MASKAQELYQLTRAKRLSKHEYYIARRSFCLARFLPALDPLWLAKDHCLSLTGES